MVRILTIFMVTINLCAVIRVSQSVDSDEDWIELAVDLFQGSTQLLQGKQPCRYDLPCKIDIALRHQISGQKNGRIQLIMFENRRGMRPKITEV
jgi:hypothetical protein